MYRTEVPEYKQQTLPSAGDVWLVGAGPGDPELLTCKALRVMQHADVVVYDRLVSPEILGLVPKHIMQVDVGKAPGCHGMKQQDINQLLVDLARGGQQVVRLKGGDPFIFGRGGEEMLFIRQAGIACHVIPGITAAVGCAASSGIPLTHRGVAQSVRFITGHARDGAPQLEWDSLLDPKQTLVFYMGLIWCEQISRGLIEHGRDPNTPVAIIENGTRPQQRVVTATLASLAETVGNSQLQSPSLLMVGDVVSLYPSQYMTRPEAELIVV
jgi:uroporphyrin-III C-methyltransferase